MPSYAVWGFDIAAGKPQISAEIYTSFVPSSLLTICLIQMMAPPMEVIATSDGGGDRGLLGVGDVSDRRLGQQ
ncbi:hypothetical protein NDI44_22400 [Trichocoleus sp. DQ-A3]|uniref:hypothetical protein n=1 Tax=Cyanophyceae TaxID=3028117 RepID=UPI001688990A|nr:hypothetical protein [Coleofasciculus sp. FACHB-125]MBD1903789.1 hypothetical protein [Coleofasciculus sp. FACHB-125]